MPYIFYYFKEVLFSFSFFTLACNEAVINVLLNVLKPVAEASKDFQDIVDDV